MARRYRCARSGATGAERRRVAITALTAADQAVPDRASVVMYDVPGSALALIKDGSIVRERGYGFRDLVTHAPVTTATLFNIGSISKHSPHSASLN
jgi:CubicO group peptidase (beta-lactamase class C family)